MSQNQDGFVNKSELGIKKVTTGKYVSNTFEIFMPYTTEFCKECKPMLHFELSKLQNLLIDVFAIIIDIIVRKKQIFFLWYRYQTTT